MDHMVTFTGLDFDPGSPAAHMLGLYDIAHALSQTCRFAGHTQEFYSVAQHSGLVAACLPAGLKKWGMLHDAAEAYLGDVPSPAKCLLPDYREMEARILRVVAAVWGLPWPMPAVIHEADQRVYQLELRFVLRPTEADLRAQPGYINPLRPPDAHRQFLRRWESAVFDDDGADYCNCWADDSPDPRCQTCGGAGFLPVEGGA